MELNSVVAWIDEEIMRERKKDLQGESQVANLINGGLSSSTSIFFPSQFLQMIENIFLRINPLSKKEFHE